ncbi:zeta toxin family protein [Asticcacaulis sp. DXS10W]|uniref:Zeta toxin family protein n=1 Tax=Asticcacaulis currens TaxID=2984210 RepID=A0ABT5ICQ0_9CAUL|nr:zeta toxin family protein [Asticcacaulis currens]MDC7693967.1 zeta toxin family protein [Asticcacaulis currens]
MPRCLIIAGPNGAGKTTFALKYLPAVGVAHSINAGLIASGLSPFHPEQQTAAAARLFLIEMEARIAVREDFAFETTLSGKTYLRLIEQLRAKGWTVELHYLALPDVSVSKRRVAERVAHGGHDIPQTDIERLFPRSLRNLLIDYRMKADVCVCYMNDDGRAEVIFHQSGEDCQVASPSLFDGLKRFSGQVK